MPPISELCPECGLYNALEKSKIYCDGAFNTGVIVFDIFNVVMLEKIAPSVASIKRESIENL